MVLAKLVDSHTIEDMNEEQFDDLKQFITSTVSQSETRLREELASKEDLVGLASKEELHDVRSSLVSLREEMRDGFTGVGEAIESLAANMDKRFNEFDSVVHRHTTEIEDHERRLTGLEHAA